MASKNISITEDVYNELLKIKGPDESFSEVILRLLSVQKKSLNEFFGAWDLDASEVAEMKEAISCRTGRKWSKQKGVKSHDFA